MAYKYCTANNWGKNFFTHEERRSFELSGQPGNIWVVGDNAAGDAWISKVSGVVKTKAEAQAIVDAEISAAQAEWDALSEEQKQNLPNRHIRPQAIILP
jgi:hypothetical protein